MMKYVQEFFVNIFYFYHDFKNYLLVIPQSLSLEYFILKLQLSINCLSSIFSQQAKAWYFQNKRWII